MSDVPTGVHTAVEPGRALLMDDLVEAAGETRGVRRSGLGPGDRVIVATRNSVYSLTWRGDGSFDISGGWFEREGRGTATVEVLGCTAGGHALLTDHVAAPGLFLELSNGVRTTRILAVRRINGGGRP